MPALSPILADIRGRIESAVVRGGHGQRVRIVAVTKGHGPEAVTAAWEAGLKDVGENRIQEALVKMEAVGHPLRWHLIGHLQRNKVKHLGRFHMLHALDSARLADAVSAWAEGAGTAVDALMQVNVSGEGTKGGFAPAEVARQAERMRGLRGIRVCGLMTMAPFDAPEGVLRRVFGGAREARATLLEAGHPAGELSMGMSSDYEIAVEEGATCVRLGTVLFGTREP